jgi:release factor glutamine methyltransferase
VTEPQPASLAAEVTRAERRLAEAGIASPHIDAVELAAHVSGLPSHEVRRRMITGATMTAADRLRLDALVGERVTRIPLQHLTGRAAFRRLELRVGPGVFIPRPETEVVAQAAIDEAVVLASRPPLVLDLCSGSGAIALSVKLEVPDARVVAVELDELAMAWARANRDQTGLDVALVRADAAQALPGLDGRVDVVVSNPPYIPTGMVPVDPEVRDHDPAVALYGGSADGLRIPLAVAQRAAALLRPGGLLVMEHADTHGALLPDTLRRAGCWSSVADHVDLSGRPRFVTARRTRS